MTWAEKEFETVDFGDKRLNNRVVKLATRLGDNPTESIPSACHVGYEAKGAYRFFENDKVTAEKILSPHINETHKRMESEPRVLLLQDTTELDYSTHYKKTGIGYLNSATHKGLLEHPLYAITEDRLPLGLVSMNWWTRESLGQSVAHEDRPIEEKETFRWLEHYRKGNRLAKTMPRTHFIVVGDRESDIYELLMEAAEAKQTGEPVADLLVRSSHNRLVKTSDGVSGKLRETVSQSAVLGHVEFALQSRNGVGTREVTQEVRSMRLTIRVTQRRGQRGKIRPFSINVIHLKEINPPEGVELVEWFLLTTVDAAGNFKKTCDIVKWYLARWEIELYFKTLKSGCTVEEIQLQDEECFLPCLALYHVIAWQIMFLVRIARVHPELCCTQFLTEDEWLTAYLIIKNKKPSKPPTIKEAIKLIAQVGGYLPRKSGAPGLKTLWRGLAKIHQFANYNQIVSKIE